MPLNRSPIRSRGRWWVTLALLITLGIGLRVSQLETPVFWVDEVATATRVAGYTQAEILAELADSAPRSPEQLRRYQQVGDRPLSATLNAFAHSPEHAPLYFLMLRGWTAGIGSSVAALRSLSVVLGLLLIPAMYGLCRQLDPLPGVAYLAMGLVAVSPYLIAYSREARPYSLWALALVLGCGALLRALRRDTPNAWGLYSLAVLLNLYTSLLSLPVLLGQGIYVGWRSRGRWNGTGRSWLGAAGIAVLGFLPWIWVMVQHRSAFADNVSWVESPLPWPVMVGVWLYSGAIVIFDVPIAPFPSAIALLQGVMALLVLGLMAWAVIVALWQAPAQRWGLGLALALPTPLVLLWMDGLQGGQVSATSRYLLPAQLGLILALAGWLGHRREKRPRSTRGIAIALILLCLLSAAIGVGRSPNYQKGRNLHNREIAAVINQTPAALVLTEAAQTFDLLSLSHNLEDGVRLKILPDNPPLSSVPLCGSNAPVLLLNPSEEWRDRLHQAQPSLPLREAYQPPLLTAADTHLSLWTLESTQPCSP